MNSKDERSPRSSKDEYFMAIAAVVSTRSTCARRAVGCVLLDKSGHILSTGYNGTPRGANHCIDSPCSGAAYPTRMGIDSCESIHAEQNAIAHCRDLEAIHTVYVTTSPCMSCLKLLLATNCELIIYNEMYDPVALDFWDENNRIAHLI